MNIYILYDLSWPWNQFFPDYLKRNKENTKRWGKIRINKKAGSPWERPKRIRNSKWPHTKWEAKRSRSRVANGFNKPHDSPDPYLYISLTPHFRVISLDNSKTHLQIPTISKPLSTFLPHLLLWYSTDSRGWVPKTPFGF